MEFEVLCTGGLYTAHQVPCFVSNFFEEPMKMFSQKCLIITVFLHLNFGEMRETVDS